MSRRQAALTIVLALAAGFAGRSLVGASWWTTAGAAVRAEARAADGDEPRWEYCAVLKAQYPGSLRGGIYWISYFKGDRIQLEELEAGPTANALAKAVTKLGQEGWELVGQGPLEVRQGVPGGTPTALYFKRRKSDK